MTARVFTFQEISNFRAYLEVQEEGQYNMFDPRARQLTGLERSDYTFVMENYVALRTQSEKEE